jgi:4-amino-4-deoxy-L-arabinose transferase-like glycosyltransferase
VTAPSERRALIALLAVFAALLFVELPGSWLIGPDEARYAEIPREMLATHDFVTPRLDSARYFEKPPLLYWLNAASMSVFGESAFAARLPTRLAALATAAVLVVELESAATPLLGLWAALILLTAPFSWVLGRYNITDGVLTLALTLAFFALRRFLAARESGDARGIRARGALAALGAATAFAVLAKGLIGIVFPGLVFLFWIAITGRWRRLGELLWSPAPIVFLLIAAPWFVLVERANPGFAAIFFVREHFARFATSEARRGGPIYYFVAAFIVGFLPWTVAFPRALAPLRDAWRTRARAHGDALFFGLWFFVILVFFSVSHSKLLPYILPAFPAAAVLTARALMNGEMREPWTRHLTGHAVLVTLVVAGGLTFGEMSGEMRHYSVLPLALLGGGLLVAGAWTAVARAPAHGRRAFFPAVLGWGGLYLALALAMPRVAGDLTAHKLAVAAMNAGAGAEIVSYRCYPQEFPWVLRHPIAVADYVDELGSDGVRSPALFWSREEFWRRWNSDARMVVVVTRRTRAEFDTASRAATPLAANRQYVVLANFAGSPDSAPPAITR